MDEGTPLGLGLRTAPCRRYFPISQAAACPGSADSTGQRKPSGKGNQFPAVGSQTGLYRTGEDRGDGNLVYTKEKVVLF